MLAKVRKNGNQPSLELHLGRSVFVTGQHLSGVVIFRLSKSITIRSLVVSVVGNEAPAGETPRQNLLKPTSFFHRDVLLSGSGQPRLTSDRISLFWNSFLGRDKGRALSPGEHAYPFSIPLPASLPPSYDGKAGKIEYTVIAKVQYPLGGSINVSEQAKVVFVPRIHRGRPMAVSYPTAGGTVHDSEIKINLELPRRNVELGSSLKGHFVINNPKNVSITKAVISLEMCEWLRLSTEKVIQRECVDSCEIDMREFSSTNTETDFELLVPNDSPPTIEGTAISVIWLLKLSLDTDPPVEFKTPLTVHAPLEK